MRWILIVLCLILMLATTSIAHPQRGGYSGYAVYQVQRPVVYAVQYRTVQPAAVSYSYQSSYSYSSQSVGYSSVGAVHSHAQPVRFKLFRPFARAKAGGGCGR